MFFAFKSELQQVQGAGLAATEITALDDLEGNITRKHFLNLVSISCQIE